MYWILAFLCKVSAAIQLFATDTVKVPLNNIYERCNVLFYLFIYTFEMKENHLQTFLFT